MTLVLLVLLLSAAAAENFAVVYATVDTSASRMLPSNACQMISVGP